VRQPICSALFETLDFFVPTGSRLLQRAPAGIARRVDERIDASRVASLPRNQEVIVSALEPPKAAPPVRRRNTAVRVHGPEGAYFLETGSWNLSEDAFSKILVL
jgi:hypothetical protein